MKDLFQVQIRELSETPNHWYFLKSAAGRNGRRTAVQIGGVLRRFPFLQGLEASKAQRYSVTNGGAYKLGGVMQVLFRQVVQVGGS